MNKKYMVIFGAVAFVIAIVLGLNSRQETSEQGTKNADRPSPLSVVEPTNTTAPKEQTITLKTNAQVGDKFKCISYDEVRYAGSASLRGRIIREVELTKIENGEYTYKSVKNQEVLDSSNVESRPGQGLDHNRLTIWVEDEYGNTLRSEGEDAPETITSGKENPTHSITVGESWNYTATVTNAQKIYKYEMKARLDSIETINGVDYAVISTITSGDVEGTSKRWMAAGKTIPAKEEVSFTTTNLAGQSMTQESKEYLVKSDDKPILP